MSKTRAAEDAPEGKLKSGKMKLVIGAVLLLCLGAGGAYGAVASGLVGASEVDHGPDVPRLVGKGEADPYAPEDDAPTVAMHGEGGSEYRTVYFSFEEGFTSNLKDSPGLFR